MTSRKGQLSFSPEEFQQPKQGLAQQESAAKQTYVVIIKQENDVPLAETSTKQSIDSLRKNLSNIGDDEYDSGISAASLFLKDDGNDDVDEAGGAVLPSAKRTRIHEQPPPRPPPVTGLDPFGSKGVVKRNLFCEELSPITPPSGSIAMSRIMASSDSPEILVQTSSAEVVDNFNTPTPSLDYKAHPAVRKIMLVSPPQYQTPSNLAASTAAVKSLYSQSPLASSTPLTLNAGFDVSTTSPDSGISLSVSTLSSSLLTPLGHDLSVGTKPSPVTHDLVPSSVTSTQAGPGLPIETKITFSRLPAIAHVEKTEPNVCEDADKTLDTSLANIQWLGAFQLGDKPSTVRRAPPPTVATRWTSEERGRRKEYNYEEITRVNQECGRQRRPPYSYMVLIQMALQSRPDQKMTLREICKWIADTFTFYMHTAKPGWKNSIRHNLSYYQCFVRATEDKKKHGARWTLQFDIEKFDDCKPVKYFEGGARTQGRLPNMIPVFVNQNASGTLFPAATAPSLDPAALAGLTPQQQLLTLQSCLAKKRTGPTPILPRPTPVRAYALVPLHGVAQQQQQLQSNVPVIFHIPASQQSQLPAVYTGLQDAALAGQAHKSIQPKPSTSTPAASTSRKSDPGGVNILRQAWLSADICEDNSPAIHPPGKESGVSTARGKCKRIGAKNSKVSASQGLPKPKMYAKASKKRTRSRIKKTAKVPEEKALLAESSDSEPDDQFEKGLPTPLRHLFQSPDNTNKSDYLATSTPLRNATLSSEYLPSPIRGLTPFRSSCGFDGSFLDILQEEAVHALKLIGSPPGDCQKSGNSPNTSLTEFGIFQISPDKGGKNLSDCHFQGLSRIFADFDPNFMTDADGLPIDMTTFNWSGLPAPSASPKDGDDNDKS